MALFIKMERTGELEIRVVGNNGGTRLSPDTYDIKHISSLLEDVENLLYPNTARERPLISYDIREGSVRHLFRTTLQTIIGFSAILAQIHERGSIDFLDGKTAQAIENLQTTSLKKEYVFELTTSASQEVLLAISPSTNYVRTEAYWAEAELYFYGVVKDAGGKKTANVHMDTEEYGYVTIEVERDFLEKWEGNILYKKFGVRASGRQNPETGEIDRKSLKMIELIDHHSTFDEKYLDQLIARARHNWRGVDADEWLTKLRGEYEV